MGALIAAIASSASLPAIDSWASASLASIATIAPPAGSAPISLPLAATSRQASWSERTPETWAAEISPIEWPANRSGFSPRDSSALWTALGFTSMVTTVSWAFCPFGNGQQATTSIG